MRAPSCAACRPPPRGQSAAPAARPSRLRLRGSSGCGPWTRFRGERRLYLTFTLTSISGKLFTQAQRSAAPGDSRVQELFRLALEAADLLEHLVDLLALAFELFAARGERSGEFLELRLFVGRGIVEREHLAHLGKGEPESLAAQNELQTHAVPLGINPATAVAPGREQTLVLIEADRPRGDVELAG